MFKNTKSKEELEKIYNKGQRFRGPEFEQDFKLSSKDVKSFNDRLDYSLNEEVQMETNQNNGLFDERTESEAINIEASTLLETSSVNYKYESPLRTISSRIRWIKGILIFMHVLTIGYCVKNVMFLDDLVAYNGSVVLIKNRSNEYFDYQRRGSKVLFGSQMFSLCIYLSGIIVLNVHLLVTFIPVQVFDPATHTTPITSILHPKKVIKYRERLTRVFQGFWIIFSIGALAQLYFFHYKTSLQAFLGDTNHPNQGALYLLGFGIVIFFMQVLKIAWLFTINILTSRLKYFCIKYNKDVDRLKKLDEQ